MLPQKRFQFFMTHLVQQLAQPVTLWFLVDLQELKNQHYNMTATKHTQNILYMEIFYCY